MSDDTTTWLKKNPAINPLRRSLKTSLRFHVPNADMDASLISNPEKAKNQEMFIPRMLQRPKMQMRLSRAHQFKVPELVVTKPTKKKENVTKSCVNSKKSPAVGRKSFLPLPKSKPQTSEKEPPKGNLSRPSFMPGSSTRRKLARREIIHKMMELSEMKRNHEDVSNQLKVTSSDNSVLRSILKKKRASLRRISQISATKPKVKKVLFDGFESSDAEDKENAANLSVLENQSQMSCNHFAALDEPTAFFNFPNSHSMESSPAVAAKESEDSSWLISDNVADSKTIPENVDVSNVLKMWSSYKENVSNLQNIRNALENSFDSLLQQTLTFQNKFMTYKKDSEEIYAQISKLSEELDENLRKVVEGNCSQTAGTPKAKRRSAGKKLVEKIEKIRLSDKSKAIRKGSGKKPAATLTKDLLKDMEDSFCVVDKKGLTNK